MKWHILVALVFLAVGCAPQSPATPDPDTPVTSPPVNALPTDEPVLNPFAPKPEDENLARGNVYLNEASIVIRESFPPQVSLIISGDLPTPCSQLRVEIGAPDTANKILVDLYSVSDPNRVCAQVLAPFEAAIDLGPFPTGHYTVWVNGDLVGEFDA